MLNSKSEVYELLMQSAEHNIALTYEQVNDVMHYMLQMTTEHNNQLEKAIEGQKKLFDLVRLDYK